MTRTDVSLEFVSDPGAEAGLVRELLVVLGQPPPDEVGDDDWPNPVGLVVARGEGRLLGWARVSAHEEDESAATADLLLVAREARPLGATVHSGHDVDESAVVVRLLAGAAEQAAGAGFAALEWSGVDDTPEGPAASELGATVRAEVGRHWGTRQLNAWPAPDGLPAVEVRRTREPVPEDLLPEYARLYHDATGVEWDVEDVAEYLADDRYPVLTLDLLGSVSDPPVSEHPVAEHPVLQDPVPGHPRGALVAQLIAAVADHTALVEKVVHRDAPAADLAALLAELVVHLRREHPGVTELSVRELDDETVGHASSLAGLHVISRWLTWRMELVADR
ncbi:hypothetical protein [Streptoalloteichus hindustanus]|uniref:Uncharacterized protein n=1 Tax=Streptoalloteichus hindustanus TaxID=2017 RepID=A0A1M4Y5M0_STRHI|nr:hypothetical protein [Streptoalloteichus hindustanus]SHF01117.1 hypothetical protein SAMN05444320_102248 [Streptoalloteichus hindustanus]